MNTVRNNSRLWFILRVDRFRMEVTTMNRRYGYDFPYINLN